VLYWPSEYWRTKALLVPVAIRVRKLLEGEPAWARCSSFLVGAAVLRRSRVQLTRFDENLGLRRALRPRSEVRGTCALTELARCATGLFGRREVLPTFLPTFVRLVQKKANIVVACHIGDLFWGTRGRRFESSRSDHILFFRAGSCIGGSESGLWLAGPREAGLRLFCEAHTTSIRWDEATTTATAGADETINRAIRGVAEITHLLHRHSTGPAPGRADLAELLPAQQPVVPRPRRR
jgi:hypothetical protein